VLSFVELRDLFASAMTGNTALLALAMSRGDWLAASRSLSALLAFGLGVALGTVMYTSHQSRRNGIRWLLVLELIFLIGCSILWSAAATLAGNKVFLNQGIGRSDQLRLSILTYVGWRLYSAAAYLSVHSPTNGHEIGRVEFYVDECSSQQC
jgi:uncharacterized membrane protein YbjE (DUF340 family)